MAFRVGQKVVYVGKDYSGSPRLDEWGVKCVPKPNTTYTIRASYDFGPRGIGYLLNEIVNPERVWSTGYHELHIEAHLLRPVVERKTDISIFTKMLSPTKDPTHA